MSGLVAGVDIGVVFIEAGGVGEQLDTGGGLGCVSSLSAYDVETFSMVSSRSPPLSFSTP